MVHGVEEITNGQRRLASVAAPLSVVPVSSSISRFAELVLAVERPLRASFVARYGPERGREATAEALAFAWENLDRVSAMANPAGYLYRVGQSRTRERKVRFVPYTPVIGMPEIEPVLQRALAKLSERQRIAVVLAHGYGYTHAEIADLLGIRRSSVQNHVERGLAALRSALGETS
jgi:DNA-directed RNA polymerase specialized sigma24 family protein